MSVAEIVCSQESHSSQEVQRYLCLDLLDANFACLPPINADCAILVEVSAGGGLLHLDRAIPRECEAILECAAVRTHARIVSCVKDERGYVVEFTVPAGQPWFPDSYFPPYLLPTPTVQQKVSSSF